MVSCDLQLEGSVHSGRKVWQEHRVAGHIVSAVRKQREMNADTQLAWPIDPTHGVVLPLLGELFPPQLNVSGNTFVDVFELVS